MGCSSSIEELEEKVSKLKIKRDEIRQRRKKKITRLENLTGDEIKRPPVPDCFRKTDSDESDSEDKKKKK